MPQGHRGGPVAGHAHRRFGPGDLAGRTAESAPCCGFREVSLKALTHDMIGQGLEAPTLQ